MQKHWNLISLTKALWKSQLKLRLLRRREKRAKIKLVDRAELEPNGFKPQAKNARTSLGELGGNSRFLNGKF